MPSKKPNKPNAFIVYAYSIKQKLIREGHVINSTADLVSAADPYWKNLSEDQKSVYKELAKQKAANTLRGPTQERPDRRDNTGALIANRVNEDEVRRQKKVKERLEVARQWPAGRDVIYERFYFIAFSLMIDHLHEDREDFEKVVPGEVSICEYSIDQGIERVMHRFINPGPYQLGEKGLAMAKSEQTHKIPIEGMAEEGDTYAKIYQDLCEFVMVGKRVVPPLFCKATEVKASDCSLNWLVYKSGKHTMLRKVYELEGLLQNLESHLAGRKPDFAMSDAITSNFLSQSAFDYERNTRCAFHEKEDVKYCSQAMVKKWGYFLSDYLCPKAGVAFTPNHLPSVRDDAEEEPFMNNKQQRNQPQQRILQQPQQQRFDQQQPQQQHQQNPWNLQQQQWNQQRPWLQQQQQQLRQQYNHQQARPQQQWNQQPRQSMNNPQQRQPINNPQQQPQQMPSQQRQEQILQQNEEFLKRYTMPGETHHSTTEGKTQHLIGRGRGLALLTQQRRPGEKRDQHQEPLGRGRGSVMRRNVSEHSALNNGMSALRSALDESVYDHDEEPSARPKPPGFESSKYAQQAAAPPASFAPQPPREWTFS